MKILKKQGLTLVLILALVVTLTLGIVLLMPARTASAEEEYILVTTQEEIEAAIANSSDEHPAYVKLDGDVTMNDGDKLWVNRGQNITIDLNGHVFASAKTTSGLLVNYWGSITFTDSSPNKTGLVKSSHVGANAYLFQNHGNLTIDTNVDFTNTVGIYNYVRLSGGEYVCKPKVTFKSGNIKVCGGYNAFLMCDASFVIEGGTFSNDSYSLFAISTFSEEGTKISGENQDEAIAADVAKRKANFDVMAEHRGSDITISGGDFSTFDASSRTLLDLTYVLTLQMDIKFYDTYNGSWSDSEAGARGIADYSVEISGGTWGYDIGAYLAPGYWTVENPDAQGTYIVERSQEDRAVVEANGSAFVSFDAAWAAAQGREAMGIDTEIKLKANCETTTLIFPESWEAGTITIDLNGFTLSVTQSTESDYHIYGYNSQDGAITLVIRDGSEEQSGELKLIYLENAKTGGIYLKDDAKFVLKSGVIRRIGGPYASDASKYNTTMFSLVPRSSSAGFDVFFNYENDMIVIEGGSIVSELNGDNQNDFVSFMYYKMDGKSSYHNSLYDTRIDDTNEYLSLDTKKSIIRLNLDTYLSGEDGEGKGCRFSWDLSILAPDLVWTGSNGGYVVTKQEADKNYYVNGEGFAEFADALVKAKAGDTISVFNPELTVDDQNVVLNGVTLDLNTYLRYAITFTHGLTLKNGAAIKNGTVKGGGVVVDGHKEGEKSATFEKVELQCALTVNANADLVIADGSYAGTVTVSEGATLHIRGGSFKGSEIKAVDPYFDFAFGAYIKAGGEYVDGTMYDVKFAPNLAAQTWYKGFSDNTYKIKSPEEWNYFAIYVNSGLDTFSGKTVQLTQEIDFGGNPSGISLFAAGEVTPFLPAGNATYHFNGSFDGQNKEITGIVAKEMYVGLFGFMGSGTLSNINLTNSKFTVGNGYLDEFNKSAGYLAGAAITGEALGTSYENLSIENVTVDFDITGFNIFSGAVIGHTYSQTTVDGLKMRDAYVNANWKLGGVVGFYEESFTLRNADISDVEIGKDSTFLPGAIVGHANGHTTTLEDCKVDAPNDSLIGTSYNDRSKNVTITGSETDIHVESLGADATDEVVVELKKDEETGKSAQVQFSAGEDGKLPSNLTIQDSEGKNLVENGEPKGEYKTDPENGSLVFEADPQIVDLYTYASDASVHQGSFASLAAALAAAEKGDRIYISDNMEENVTVEADKDVILNLNGHTLTGTIAVAAGGKLTLENGTVEGTVTVDESGTLVLAVPALAEGETEIKELRITVTEGKAVDGKYTLQTNDNKVCVRAGESEIYLAKEHEVGAYSAEGAVITVKCQHCGETLGTVTVVAPEDATFGNEKIEATVTVEPEGLVEAPVVTYKRGEIAVEAITEAGTYTASIEIEGVTASVTFSVKQKVVTISDIQGEMSYSGETEPTLAVKSFVLKDLAGNPVATGGFTVTVTLKKSQYNVGEKQIALITAITMTGNENYALSLVGNQAFMEIDVSAAMLTVRVNGDGSVSYEGFVGGEDESVLGGSLKLDYVDNGDGTTTVTPGGLESENYHIVYVSGTVATSSIEGGMPSNSNGLVIRLSVGAALLVLLGAGVVVFALRRKHE